jgi:hypothetical protein
MSDNKSSQSKNSCVSEKWQNEPNWDVMLKATA